MADELVWAPDLDNDPADYSTASNLTKSIFLVEKAMWLSVPGASCLGSSNGVAAGMDGVDRWASAADIVRASSGARSWFVVGGLINFCVELNGTTDQQPATYAFSRTPFTGGSTTARPTSPDEFTFIPGAGNQLHDTTASLFRTHMVYTTRGDWWLWNHKVGIASPENQPAYFALAVTKLKLRPGITDPNDVVAYVGGGGYGFRYDTLFGNGNTTSGWRGRTAGGALVTMAGATITPTGSTCPLQNIPSAGGNVTKAFPRLPLTVWPTTTGFYDYKGEVVDVKVGPWGMSPGAADVAGAPTRRLIGCAWLPGMSAAAPSY